MNELTSAFTPELLMRRAIVHFRQSTQGRMMTYLECQRRQYDLAGMARAYGFAGISVIENL